MYSLLFNWTQTQTHAERFGSVLFSVTVRVAWGEGNDP